MNCKPEASGCWYCMTDFKSPLGRLYSREFDCLIHVECLEYEHNHNRKNDMDDFELDIFPRESEYII